MKRLLPLISVIFAARLMAGAQDGAALQGRIVDPLGAAVAGARVTLQERGATLSTTEADRLGRFRFRGLPPGDYSLRIEQAGFRTEETGDVYLSGSTVREVEVRLKIGPLQESLVVTPTGSEIPEAQTGAAVSFIGREHIERHDRLEVLDAVRFLSGVQVAQTGGYGGLTTLFLRGGDSNFHKVLVDGVPVNDIGGFYDFSALTTDNVERIEVLRGPNSVLYGSDAVSGVIHVLSRRGHDQVKIPRIHYRVEGGNFGTLRQAVGLAGAFRSLDYASEFSRFDTNNNLPNETFHNATYSGNFGWQPDARSTVRFTLRRLTTALGAPNAIDLFGLPDDSAQRRSDTYLSLGLSHQTTGRWRNQIRFNSAQVYNLYTNPSPTGEPFDPFGIGPNYLGLPVTITGGNGYRVNGRAILDYDGLYPSSFRSDTVRQSAYLQSDLQATEGLSGTFGFRYESERGVSGSLEGDRGNFGYFLEGQYRMFGRLFAVAGMGIENNAVFGVAINPRVSLAYYLRKPSGSGAVNETRLRFNYGTGIKEPALFEEGQSLFRVLLSAGTAGGELISRYGLSPIGPERSRSFDAGLDQYLWDRRLRLGISAYHNRFEDLIEFVPGTALPMLGIPPEVIQAAGYGVYLNAQSFRALGVEGQVAVDLGHGLLAEGNYTFLDARVTRSFSSDALSPSFNPAFPGIPIGAFSPLVGQRPFQRASHVGSLLLSLERPRWGVAGSAYLVGRRDGSTFLSDPYFGNSLLLPNRNLNPAYQRVDVSGQLTLNSHLSLFATIGNLFNQRYT
ncbi:MAG: TonB-dependent receptor, partial [Acidobacteria bacterium]|nr:TonB-dependent receptor [Acidobacteriota bacterium]